MKYNSANMNTLIKSCLTLCLLWSAIGSHAQVIKKSDTDDSKKTTNQLSVRAQSLYDTQDASDADIPWMRVIYRQIDLNKEKNMPLYYPEESTENQENLFRIVMKLLANNQIPAYEYLDGREIFTDEYRIKVKEMFDRFHILYAPAKGYSEKNPRFTVEESDIPSNEVLSYYILEKWIFDRRTSQVKPSIEAICPVLHRTGDFGGEAVKYPMFWVKYNDIRPYIARQYILASNENNVQQYNYDDYFQMRMYEGEIYKTQNLRNQSLMQMYPNDSIRKQAQDSIEKQLKNFNEKLWVPSPEEIAKAKEEQAAKEAKENGGSVYDITNEWVASIEPQDSNVIFLPFLNGSNEDPLAKGTFVGLTAYHSKKHMLRAVYEGIVFSHMTHVKKLLRNREVPQSIRLSGGAANSDVWVQIFADTLQIPIDVVGDKELGAQGAAMAAGIAAGVYKDYREAIEKTVKITKTIYPRPEYKEIYEEKYATYRAVIDGLSSAWKRFKN